MAMYAHRISADNGKCRFLFLNTYPARRWKLI